MPSGAGPQSTDPLGPPSSTTWRRERLLRIGSSIITQPASDADVAPENQIDDPMLQRFNTESPLQEADGFPSYGTIPRSPHHLLNRRSLASFKPTVPLFRSLTDATIQSNNSSKRDFTSRLNTQRPISAYDAALRTKDGNEQDADAKINGIRVWYSSYSSIDWLHDAIKDSVRFSKLRRRKSIRAKLRLFFDKSLGWVIVTVVGFLTALVAFLVVRSEQWLFDLKEGYCQDSLWLAKRFCCPGLADTVSQSSHFTEETCSAWRTWADVFWPTSGDVLAYDIIQYIPYALIAVILALTSCLLTIYLTNSSTFVTRKESGVLSPDFEDDQPPSKDQAAVAEATAPTRRKIMYYAAGSGIPEIKTILSGFVIHGYLGGRTLFTKSVGLALSVGSGLSLGKEGPFVHIASCIGNIVSRFSSKYETNEAKRREILSAACAAGVAVAFGAPIGGTLFSLEEVSYFFPPKVMWRSFFCAMIAAITLKMLDPFGTGKLVLFQVTYHSDWHGYELFPFLLLGVFGGIYGAYFSKLNFRWCRDIRNKTFLQSHPVLEVLVITLVTTIICFLNPYTRMGGTELVSLLFSECRSGKTSQGLCVGNPDSFTAVWPVIRAIGVAMVSKAALTVVTFGIKLPAGIFVPTLGVGACAGRILGIGMQLLQVQHPNVMSCGGDPNCIIPGLYAMVGAAATLSGVTRTTVSLAVIMFELTDTLTYAVPIMLSVLVAKTVADALEPKGIYDLVIDLTQLPYLDYKHEYLWGNLQISDVTERDVEVIRIDEENTVRSLCDKLLRLVSSGQDDGSFPILRKDSDTSDGTRLVGCIGANELEHALSIVADNGDDEVKFGVAYTHDLASSSMSSLFEGNGSGRDPFDFTPYMDQAPLTIQLNSPMELLHQFFVKLGAKYVIVTDSDGYYEGVIDKKTWLAFLSDLEEKT